MTFRSPREEDYFGSYLRRNVFQNLLRREIAFDTIFGWAKEESDAKAKTILTDDSNPLSGWQDEDASGHWKCELINSMSILFSAPVLPSRTLRSTGYPRSVQFRIANFPLSSSSSLSFASSVSDVHFLMIKLASDERGLARRPLGDLLKNFAEVRHETQP